MSSLAILATCGLAAAAHAQHITYSVLLSTSGPVPSGTTVSGTVRCEWVWAYGAGYAGGAFRLRMDGLSIGDVLSPDNSTGGINGEDAQDRVSVPAAELPPGAGTVSDRWIIGRRPKRAYLADATDPGSIQAGGGFRFPPIGTHATDMHYSVEAQSGITYLTGRNGSGVETQIGHVQLPRSLLNDPLFYEPAAALDLFKFTVRAPRSGTGTVTITPEVLSATAYDDTGRHDHHFIDGEISAVGVSFSYVPGPGGLLVLTLASFTLLRVRARIPRPPERREPCAPR
jgi:hypothetical protein